MRALVKLLPIVSLLVAALLAGACGVLRPGPGNMTATAEAQVIFQLAATGRSVMQTATADGAATAESEATATAIAPTATPAATATPDPFPTRVKASIYVAEQQFEGGSMLWLQPNSQIWLLTEDEAGQKVWSVFDDTFSDGQAESDPQIVPPEGLYQPVRGFGKLWRENPEVRLKLGWAVAPEVGHTTRYRYYHGGHVTEDMEYIPAPGYHLVDSVSGERIRFDEETMRWRIND